MSTRAPQTHFPHADEREPKPPDTIALLKLKAPDSALELKDAALRDSASFAQYFRALYEGQPGNPGARADVIALDAALYENLLHAFEAEHGPIEQSFYANSIQAGAVLTRHPNGFLELAVEIYWDTVHFDADEARHVYFRLNALRDRVNSFLTPTPSRRRSHIEQKLHLPERQAIGRDAHEVEVRFLYGIAKDLIASISREQLGYDGRSRGSRGRIGQEDLRKPSARHHDEMADLQTCLAGAEESYAKSATRAAQQWYWRGTAQGAGWLVVGLAAAVIVVGILGSWDPTSVALLLASTALAGALGALVSVLQRLSTSGLRMNYETEHTSVKRNGYFRPFVGAVSGVVSYGLLAGGLLAIDPGSGASRVAFYVSIAFVAGFSERFARDLLSGSAALVSKPLGGATDSSSTAARTEPM